MAFSTASMVVCVWERGGEKLGGDLQIGQPACWRCSRESLFFSGVVTLSNAINDSTKSYHIWGLPAESVQVAYVDWREKCTCHVYQVSSNRYDSQI
jgi:hypothetical protein